VPIPPTHPLNAGGTASSTLVQNLRGTRTKPLPVWFMRQAGRSLPEYRALRANYGMLESCLTPEIATQITLQPVRRHNVDAAIFFSDIVVPLKLAGLPIDIQPGVGPVLSEPIRTEADLHRLKPLEGDALGPITEAVTALVADLGATPLIGFGGAPFTLASYVIEGGPSRTLPHSRAMMATNEELWSKILSWCADVTGAFISAQVMAGASTLQVFDSWAGRLAPDDYRTYAAPYSARLFESLDHLVDDTGTPVPRLHFGVGTAAILTDMYATGATAMGVDAHTSLAAASATLGHTVAVQGNIDPEILVEPWPRIDEHIRAVIADGSAAPGHVVNLGHGVPPTTDPDVLTRIVSLIHDITS
jgi:uroporphyrinogen decarboxylase